MQGPAPVAQKSIKPVCRHYNEIISISKNVFEEELAGN